MVMFIALCSFSTRVNVCDRIRLSVCVFAFSFSFLFLFVYTFPRVVVPTHNHLQGARV